MRTLPRQDIPADFSYYRTGSRVFFEYFQRQSHIHLIRIGKWYEFIKSGKLFGNFWSIDAEKVDIEPSPDFLRKQGIQHGIVYWTPLRRDAPSAWWYKLPSIFPRMLLHSSRSAFSILTPEYWNNWSSKARGHRRKILELQKSGKLRIESTDMTTYLDIYTKTKVPDPHKSYLTQICRGISPESLANIRIYLAYIDDTPLAWGVFIDEWVTSEYFTSFYDRSGHPYHLGVAMMDHWFAESLKKGIKYCDLDHMRDKWQSFGYSGYTEFKKWIAEYEVYFHDMWMRIF